MSYEYNDDYYFDGTPSQQELIHDFEIQEEINIGIYNCEDAVDHLYELLFQVHRLDRKRIYLAMRHLCREYNINMKDSGEENISWSNVKVDPSNSAREFHEQFLSK